LADSLGEYLQASISSFWLWYNTSTDGYQLFNEYCKPIFDMAKRLRLYPKTSKSITWQTSFQQLCSSRFFANFTFRWNRTLASEYNNAILSDSLKFSVKYLKSKTFFSQKRVMLVQLRNFLNPYSNKVTK